MAWAIRVAVNSSTGHTPGQMAFNKDMIFQMDQLVNWEAIKATRNELAIAANIRENQSRVEHVYNVGDKILILHDRNEPKAKLGPPT